MNAQTAHEIVQQSPEAAREVQAKLQEVLARSATDAEFRRKLLTAPRAALSEFSGREVPESLNIAFIENTVDATIVLPDAVDPEAELSEQELEAVAGGTDPLTTAVVSLVIAVGGLVAVTWAAYNTYQEGVKNPA
jgi:hypothetical protein